MATLPTTLRSALDTDRNVLHDAHHVAATKALDRDLWAQRHSIEALVRHHLGLGGHHLCTVARPSQWLHGSFNVCVPVEVHRPGEDTTHLLLRCAMPHKLAEAQIPGSVDDKTAAEVGTYAWIDARCPDIRIPRLYGFGFSDHRHFTHEDHHPLHVRIFARLRRLLRSLWRPSSLSSRFLPHPSPLRLPSAYLLLEHVGSDASQMLSATWNQHRSDPVRRRRLFRGIARLMLALARVPQPQIGSFCFRPDDSVALARPLLCAAAILENDGTPRTVGNRPYRSVEPFVADLFAMHDARLLTHPNAAYDVNGYRGEMAAKVLLRALTHRFSRSDRRDGPFVLQLDDLHASNIFVDADWNVTCLIDLEWVAALPVEKLAVPYWLTGCSIDDLRGEHLDEFDRVRKEFMDVLEEERSGASPLSRIMQESWQSGSVWFWHCLSSINAMYPLFTDHISPRFSLRLLFREEEFLSRFWTEDAAKVVETKVDEYHQYEADLARLFDGC